MKLFFSRGDTSVHAGPLIPLPDDQRPWMSRVIGLFDEIVRDEMLATVDGWPVRIVIARTGVQWRAHAFYAFLEHAAAASISGSQADVDANVDILRTGAPSWTDEACSLFDLFDL